jgi:hypothetical protein
MDRVYVRTCSAAQAAALAAADGKWARVGAASVQIRRPAGREPIDRDGPARYLARVEVLDDDPPPAATADSSAADVLSELFGPYFG